MLLAGVGPAAADLGVGAEAAAAQLKLLASLPPDSGASAQRVAARFHLDPVNWYSRVEASEILPAVANAVWGERRIRVRYESWRDLVDRDLDPLGLVLKAGVWYLVAAVKGQARTYRVSNIRALEVLSAKAQRPARFDLGALLGVVVARFRSADVQRTRGGETLAAGAADFARCEPGGVGGGGSAASRRASRRAG